MAYITDINITEKKSFSPIYHKPFELFSPSYQLDYSWAPSVIIDSPGSSGATITTKKEATQTPTIEGSDTAQSDLEAQDYTGLVLILGVIVVGGYIAGSWLKKKKKK